MMDGDLTLITGPALEPIDRDTTLKSHLRIDHDDENDLLDALIIAAREYYEAATRRALITQTWQLTLDAWPGGNSLRLPKPPLQSISHIKYLDEGGLETTWASSNYVVDTAGGRVALAKNISWPTVSLYPVGAVRITFAAGHGAAASNVPQRSIQAIKLLIGHWYENREATVMGGIPREVPFALESLIYLDRAY